MVKKLQKLAEKQKAASGSAGLLDSHLAQNIRESAQQIWLAGLGAFSKAQGEGQKVFDTLMKEGLTLHRKTQSAAEEKIGDVTGRMSAMAGQVGQQAGASWDKLESIFEERTARALKRLGMPTAAEIAALVGQLEALKAEVAQLKKAGAAAAAGDAPKPAPRGRRAAAAAPATPVAAAPAAPPARKASARAAARPATPTAPAPKRAAAPRRKPARKAAA